MSSVWKTILIVAGALAVIGAATILVIKYFDVLTALADRIKDAFTEKKHALFSKKHCAEIEDEA